MTVVSVIEVALRARLGDFDRNMRAAARTSGKTSESIRTGISKASKQSKVDLEGLVKQIQGLSRQSAKVKIDDAEAKGRLKSVQDDLAKLARAAADPEIQLDTAVFDAKLGKVVTELDSLKSRTVDLKLNVDNEGVQQVNALQRQIASLRDKRYSVKISADGSAAKSVIEDIAGDLEALTETVTVPVEAATHQATSALQEFRDKLFEVAKAGVALSPALVPVLAGITTAAAGAVGAVTPLAAGIALFGFAAKQNLPKVIEDLSVMGNEAINAWRALTETVKPQSFAVLNNGFRILNTLVGQIRPLMVNAANSISVATESFAHFFETSDRWRGFVDAVTRTAGPTIDNFSRALLGLLGTFASVGTQLAPLGVQITGGLASGLERLNRWVESDTFRRGLQAVVEYARQNGPLVGETLRNLAGALIGILEAAAPLGPVMLRIVNVLAQVIGAVAGSPFGPWIIGIGSLALAARAAIGAITAFRAALAGAAFQSFVTSLASATFYMSTFTAAVLGNAAAMAVLGPRATAAATAIRGFFTGTYGVVGGVAKLGAFAAAIAAVYYLLDRGNETARKSADQIKRLNDGFQPTSIQDYDVQLRRVNEELAATTSAAGAATDKEREFVQQFNSGGKKLVEYRANLEAARAVMVRATENTTALARSFSLSEQQVRDLAAAHRIDLAGSLLELDGRFGQITGQVTEADRAMAQYRGALGGIDAATKHTSEQIGTQITAYTQLGDAAETTGAKVLDQALKNAQAAIQQSANIKKLLEQGVLSPAQIQELAQQGPRAVAAVASLSLAEQQKFVNASNEITRSNNEVNRDLTISGSNEVSAAAVAALNTAKARITQATAGMYASPLKQATDEGLIVLADFNVRFPGALTRDQAEQRERILQNYLNTIPEPLREAVRQAITAAQAGGANVATTLALALASKKPELANRAEEIRLAIQTKIDAIKSPGPIDIVANDRASAVLRDIGLSTFDLSTKLLEAGFSLTEVDKVVEPATNPRSRSGVGSNIPGRAAGGPIPGYDRFDRDTVNAKLTRGEWVIRRQAVDTYGHDAMAAVNSGRAKIGYAKGGAVGFAGGGYVLNATVQGSASGFDGMLAAAQSVEGGLLNLSRTAGATLPATRGQLNDTTTTSYNVGAGLRSLAGTAAGSFSSMRSQAALTSTSQRNLASTSQGSNSLISAALRGTATQSGLTGQTFLGMARSADGSFPRIRGQVAGAQSSFLNAANAAGAMGSRTAGGAAQADAAIGRMSANIQGAIARLPRNTQMNIKADGIISLKELAGFSAQADGGILQAYASGGVRENHVAQIAQAGTYRLWAEDETGGEAYIPLAPSKRRRSMAIWRKTGQMLGAPEAAMFADGGVQQFAAGGFSGIDPRAYTDNDIPPFIDDFKRKAYDSVKKRTIEKIKKQAATLASNFGDGPSYEGGGNQYVSGQVAGLQSFFFNRLVAMAMGTGKHVSVTSGRRSTLRQAALYSLYLAGRGNLAAKPGTSKHEKGLAADLATPRRGSVGGVAGRYGLAFTVPSEDWHIEPRAQGGITAPDGREVRSYATGGVEGRRPPVDGNFLKFVAAATQLASGKKSLAIKAMQRSFGMSARDSDGLWDYPTTDWLIGHDPKPGYRDPSVNFLQAKLKRKQTGVMSSGDIGALQAYLEKNVWTAENNPNLAIANKDRLTSGFQSNLLKLVKRGYAPLADYLEKQGPEQAWRVAGQYANAQDSVLKRTQDSVIRTAARDDSKFGDALGLASKLAQYGGKVGLLGLANRSGTSVADTLGLITSYPDVFNKLGSTAKTLQTDLDRLSRGLQPVPAYAGGAHEIKRDHLAMVHRGETIAPRSYAEPWRQNMRPASSGMGGGSVIQRGAVHIDLTVGPGTDPAEFRQIATEVVTDALVRITQNKQQGVGAR